METQVNPHPKPKRIVCETYLDFIRQQNCLVPLCPNYTEPHHLKQNNGSDLSAVPLCRKHHTEYHAKGLEQFELKHMVRLWYEAWRLLHEWLTEVKNCGLDGECN